jgi:hypothetical protein
MQTIARLRKGLFVATVEAPDERALQAWVAALADHVFIMRIQDDRTIQFRDIGRRDEACREPVNIVYDRTEPPVQLISNLAHTPFELDDRLYASVEGFWQGLKFDEETARAEIAGRHGQEARRSGQSASDILSLTYEGREVRVGTHEHWALMRRACSAKFEQHEAARAALLATGIRPLEHRVRRDSKTIPGVLMAEIWMEIRKQLAEQM